MPEPDEHTSDFARPRWSVINSETSAASNLTYAEAVEKLRALSETTHGLCIVTDQAAERLHGTNQNAQQSENEDLSRKQFAEML